MTITNDENPKADVDHQHGPDATAAADADTRRTMKSVKDEMDAALAGTSPAPALPHREHFTGAEWIVLRDVLGHRIAQHSGETIEVSRARAIAEGLLADELIIIPSLNTRVSGYAAALAAEKDQR